MKIAQVSPYDYAYPGGVSGHISRLKENFTRMGHTVKVTPPPPRRLGDDAIFVGGPVISIPPNGSIART